MMTLHRQPTILLITTFFPRKCGIASFSQDFIEAITPVLPKNTLINICALDKKSNAALYKYPVTMLMDGYDFDSCMEKAAVINGDDTIQLVCIEHEFGLFGGDMGEFLLGFLAMLEKPFIIRFHTVLPAPDTKRLKIVQAIATLANRVIVMTNHSLKLLEEDYQVSAEKLMIIPHGTHNNSTVDPAELKRKYKLEDKLVLTTFGLLSPNKGIEKAIIAMKDIKASFPNAMYIVVGQTHPTLLALEGEKYREYLQQLIAENGLQENVRLTDEYVHIKKLMEYLALTDIYLFTSKDPNQAVSGTFLYAMSAGCPIISNSFVLAKEMLDEKTGVILETNKETELAEKAIFLLKNDMLRKQMGLNAFLKTRNTAWKKVAANHTGLFNEILGKPVFTPTLYNQLIN
jgi:glycosyltransferase involved in cell wall biosynthesis